MDEESGDCKAVAFSVQFDDGTEIRVPKRLKQNITQKQPLTAEHLDKKMRMAEERRKVM